MDIVSDYTNMSRLYPGLNPRLFYIIYSQKYSNLNDIKRQCSMLAQEGFDTYLIGNLNSKLEKEGFAVDYYQDINQIERFSLETIDLAVHTTLNEINNVSESSKVNLSVANAKSNKLATSKINEIHQDALKYTTNNEHIKTICNTGKKECFELTNKIVHSGNTEIDNNREYFFNKLKNVVKNVVSNPNQIVNTIKDTAKDVIKNPKIILDTAKDLANKAKDTVKDLANKAKDTAKDIGNKIKDTGSSIANKAKKIILDLINKIKNVIQKLANSIVNMFKKLFNSIVNVIKKVGSSIILVVSKIILTVQQKIVQAIKVMSESAKKVIVFFNNVVKSAQAKLSKLFTAAKTKAGVVTSKAKQATVEVKKFFSNVLNFIFNILKEVVNFITGVPGKLVELTKYAKFIVLVLGLLIITIFISRFKLKTKRF